MLTRVNTKCRASGHPRRTGKDINTNPDSAKHRNNGAPPRCQPARQANTDPKHGNGKFLVLLADTALSPPSLYRRSDMWVLQHPTLNPWIAFGKKARRQDKREGSR